MTGKFSRKQLIILIGAVVLLGVLYILFTSGSRNNNKPPEVKLSMWGVDEKRVMDNVISGYTALRPNVHIIYQQIPAANYRDAILNALASGNGPDVFMVPNQSIPRYADKLAPVNKSTFNAAQLQDLFPAVVAQDFVVGGDIYALPLSLDTLALIYNRDALDQASLTSPPVTWTDVQHYVPFLRTVNGSGQLTRAAVAIGGTEKTVKNAVDILALLMMQNSVKLNDAKMTRILLSSDPQAVKVMTFYLQFANTGSTSYTWNEDQPYSMDALVSGRTTMLLGYYSDYVDLEKKNPFANFAVAPMPQLQGASAATTYARYWGFAVSKQATPLNQSWGWDFVLQTGTNTNIAKLYANATGRLPALRSLIGEKLNDERLAVFAKQALTAKSWRLPDEDKARQIISDAIGSMLRGQVDALRGLHQAEEQVNQISAFKPE